MSFDPFSAGFDLVKTALDKFFPDATEEMKEKFVLANQEVANEMAAKLKQLDINAEEAKHPSVFVAGARPAAMWVGVATLLYSGIISNLISWVAMCFGLPVLPVIDVTTQNNILMGLLGLGAARTVEKINKVETKGIKK